MNTHQIKEPPESIYLTTGDNSAKCFNDPGEVTWCKDMITDLDIKYIRADLTPTSSPAGELRIPKERAEEAKTILTNMRKAGVAGFDTAVATLLYLIFGEGGPP